MNKTLIKLCPIVVFIVALVVIVEMFGWRENFSLEYLRATIKANFLLGTIIFIGMFTLGNLIQVPGWIFLAAAIMALGKVEGGLLIYVAAISSCLVTYGIVGYMGEGALRGIDNKLAKKLLGRLDSQPIQSVVVLRTIFGAAPVLNYSLALSGVRFKYYIAGSALGLAFSAFAHVMLFELLAKHLFDIAVVN